MPVSIYTVQQPTLWPKPKAPFGYLATDVMNALPEAIKKLVEQHLKIISCNDFIT